MSQQPFDLLTLAIPFAIILVSLTIHEAAHAWTADKLGDPTARLLGRVSLNPVVHIDPIGTILLPLLAAYSNMPIIGWAKPVPVNISRFHHPYRDFGIVAAAGPLSNLLQAVAAAAVIHALWPGGQWLEVRDSMALDALIRAVEINILLALFNLIPVPPLDGGNVLAGLLPPAAANVFLQIRPWGFIVLYAMLLTGMVSALILPPARVLARLLL